MSKHDPIPPVRVETPLGALSVRQIGSGRVPLVLWPSIFTDGRIFDRVVRDLGPEARALVIDGPGHGHSAGPQRPFALQDCARAMAAVMDHFGLDRAVVGGVSWGGLVGAELALTDPDRVRALILMNTPMTLNAAAPGLGARMIALGARRLTWSALFRNGIARSFFDEAALAAGPYTGAQFHRMLAQADARTLGAAVSSVLLHSQPLLPRLAGITLPTLVIAGRADAMYPLEVQAQAAVTLPRGRFEPVAGKHISPIEAPEQVALALQRFLAEVLA